MTEIGLFPLNLVLLPRERAPLHIFEDRYKELIGECLESDGEFGLLLAETKGLHTVGTSAAIVEVLNRYEDGRLDVVVEGRDRFRITQITQGHSYMSAEIQPFEDDETAADPALVSACMESLGHLASAAGTDAASLEVSGDNVAWQIASQVDFGPELKQQLLEMRVENERLERLTEALEEATTLVTTQREIKQRAAGNGKVDDL